VPSRVMRRASRSSVCVALLIGKRALYRKV